MATQKYRRALKRKNYGRLNPGTRKYRTLKSSERSDWRVYPRSGQLIAAGRRDLLSFDAAVDEYGYAELDLKGKVLNGNWEVYFEVVYRGSTMGQPPHPGAGDLVLAACTNPGCLSSPSINKPPDGTQYIGFNFQNHQVAAVEGIVGGAEGVGGTPFVPTLNTRFYGYLRRQADTLQIVFYSNNDWTGAFGDSVRTRTIITVDDFPHIVACSFGDTANAGRIAWELTNFSFTL